MSWTVDWSCDEEMAKDARAILESKARRVHGRRYLSSHVDAAYRSKVEADIALRNARRTRWLGRATFPDSSSLPLLDIGCGFGTFVLACRALGLEAHGVDMGEGEIAFARRRQRRVLGSDRPFCFHHQRAETLPFPDQRFRIVTLWTVIEHVPRWKELLEEAARVLEPGGLLLLVAPNYLSTWKEPHFHVPWLPLFALLPRAVAGRYVSWLGLGRDYYDEELALVHVLPVARWLAHHGFDIGFGHELLLRTAPERAGETDHPSRALSTAASVSRQAERLGVGRLLEGLIGLYAWFPLRSVVFYARKGGQQPEEVEDLVNSPSSA